MSKGQVHIRCSQCGKFNVNEEHCISCGSLLSIVRQREEERNRTEKIRIEKALLDKPSKTERFVLKMMNHKWLLVRLFFQLIHVVWITVMAIAMFLAWLIGIILA